MKKITLDALDSVTTEDVFLESVKEVNSKKSTIERKTFTLERRQVDYINQIAAAMSQQHGKPINASIALREIINQHKEIEK